MMKRIGTNYKKIIRGVIYISVCSLAIVGGRQYEERRNRTTYVLQDFKNEPRYDTEQAIKKVFEELSEEKATIIRPIEISEKKVSFIFEGNMKEDITRKMIEALKTYQYQGTFFYTAQQIAEDESVLNPIIESGNSIGSLGLDGVRQMNQLSREELVEQLGISSQIMASASKGEVTLLRGDEMDYTDEVLRIAKASGYQYVVESTTTLNEKSFKTYESTLNYIKKLKQGSIIAFSLNEKTDTKKLLNVMTWTFEACKALGYEGVRVEEIYK